MKVILLFILLIISSLYIPLNRQDPKFNFKIKLDSLIPLQPWTVWVYSIYYFLFPLSIALTWNTAYAIPFLITQIAGTSLASLIWKVFPNGVARPQIESTYNHNHRFLSLFYYHDRDCNGLPSGHVLHTFVACFFLAKLYPTIWMIFPVILLAISLSTLTTKQHYIIDMVFTLLLSPLLIELTLLLV